jgi:hypothetical protein
MIFHYFLEAKDRNNDAKGQKGGQRDNDELYSFPAATLDR